MADLTDQSDTLIDWRRKFKDVRIDHFQVFGERRSGTNFVESLIEANTDLTATRSYGWKHGFPSMPCIKRTGLMVAVFREPISWLISLHNRPFVPTHRNLEFSDFLRKWWRDMYIPRRHSHKLFGYEGMPAEQGVMNQMDRHPLTGRAFKNPLEMRALKYGAYEGFVNRRCNCVLVDYDTVKRRGAAVIGALGAAFDLPVEKTFQEVGRVGPRGSTAPYVKREEISAEDMAFIRANLDPELETRLGFGAALVADEDEARARA